MANEPDAYLPIADYAYLSDCHSAALVSKHGSIDWCCMPRVDSGSVFGRLLDAQHGGFCSLSPVGDCEASRSYVEHSLVLQTVFRAGGGEARVSDCFTMRRGGRQQPRRELLRIVEGVRGTIDLALHIAGRFDYGDVRPWVKRHGRHVWTLTGGDDALLAVTDADVEVVDGHDLHAVFTVAAGDRVRLSLRWFRPEELDPSPPAAPAVAELDARLDETLAWWRRWSARGSGPGVDDRGVMRSAIVCKGLTNAPTGAVAAAPTTSLPEAMGGSRNWDYRYSWVRDSQFTVRSLGELGFDAEADGFRRFVERSAAGSAESLRIMYGVGGERRLTEVELDGLDGYRGSRPVRVGNGAAAQRQLDVYGYLLDLAWRWHERGQSPDDDYWRFLLSLVHTTTTVWEQPDRGIWEVRGDPQHFVHSKAMCWVAIDRGIRLAEECLRRAPLREWKQHRDAIRRAVEEQGYDDERGIFVRSFGHRDLDASLLLLPAFGFVPYDDERMVRTTDAVAAELDGDALLRRYDTDDGLDGREASFVACSFWLAECYARQGRVAAAQAVYDRATATANDLGLFAEEYDQERGELLGNFPQGLTHLSHITAAVALAQAKRR